MNSKIKKTIVTTFVLVLFILSAGMASKNSETIIVKTNIYCDHCKECSSCSGRIERDLGFNTGIKLVKLDEKAMTITIIYNPKKTKPEEIRKTISMYGFDADHIKADPTAYDKLDECCKKK